VSRDKITLVGGLPPNPTLGDLLETLARAVRLGLRVALPATVVTYNATTQKANITLQFLAVTYDENAIDGEAVQEPTIVQSVPVAWPRTSFGYLTFPLLPGDTGQVVICDRSIEEWLRLGVPVDPAAAWAHALQDAVFYPGMHPDTNPISPATDLTATVLEGTAIKLGRTATQKAVLADTLISVIDAVLAAGSPVAMDGGASLKATMITAWNGLRETIKATKTSVE
jgi:hypothetical protein